MLKRTAAVLVATTVLLPQSSRPERQVTVPLPGWSSGGICAIRQKGAVIQQVNGNRSLSFPCPARIEESVTCDLSGSEPVDLPLTTVCERGQLPILRARTVAVEGITESPLTAEWLDVRQDGSLVSIAQRQLSIAGPNAIQVAIGPQRLVRFLQPGSAPRTFASQELAEAHSFRLPPPTTGAELVVRVIPRPVKPHSYEVGDGLNTVSYSHGAGEYSAVRGLRPGTYQIVPTYPGGVRGLARSVELGAGMSALVTMPDEHLGGIRVILQGTTCSAARSLEIVQLLVDRTQSTAGGEATRIQTTTVLQAQTTQCDSQFGGLISGWHEVVVRSEDRELVRRRIPVVPNVYGDVLVEGSTTHVTGRVTFNRRPLPQAQLVFRTSGASSVRTASTDDDGNYALDLERAGSYVVTLRLRGLPTAGQQKEIGLVEGDNTLHWDISGGSLGVKLQGFQASNGGIQFDLEPTPASADGRGGLSHVLPAADPQLAEGLVTFRALVFGTYSVRATQRTAGREGRRRVSEVVTFSISESRPEATVTLTLNDNAGLLLLRDLASPVRLARVYGLGVSAREVEPGTFSMDGIAAGQPLNIRATSYVPLCRNAPDGSALTVQMDHGRPVEVQFPGADPSTPSPLGRISWTGIDCPIALDAFSYTRISNGSDGQPRFMIANFPIIGAISHSFAVEPSRQHTVIGGQVVVIPFHKDR